MRGRVTSEKRSREAADAITAAVLAAAYVMLLHWIGDAVGWLKR